MPRRLQVVVDGTPAEVAARLAAKTRPRWFPAAATLGGTSGLGGRVRPDGFRVALDHPGRWAFQAVAVGVFVAVGPNRTRIDAELGLPVLVTWGLRTVFLFLPLAVGLQVLSEVISLGSLAVGAFAVHALATAALATVVVGATTDRANAQVETLLHEVRTAAGAPSRPAPDPGVR